jgi:MFS family permease
MLYAISGVSGYFLNDLNSILIGRAFLGIAVGGISTIAVTLIGDLFSGEERSKFIGLQAAAMSLGGVVFISLGGFLAQINWRLPFLIYILALLVLLLSIKYLKSENKQTKSEKTKANFKDLIPFVGIYVISFLAMVSFYLIPTQIPFLLKSIGIKEPSLAGIAVAFAILCASFVSVNYSKIKTRFSAKIIFFVMFLLMSIGYLLISFSNSYWQIVLALGVSGLGVGLIMPSVNTAILQKASESIRGTATGFLTTFVSAGQFLSRIIVSILPVSSISSVFAVIGLGAIVISFPIIQLYFGTKKI